MLDSNKMLKATGIVLHYRDPHEMSVLNLAEKEIAYIVMGGQDGREYANSIAFLLQVLDSLRDKEDTEWKDSADGVA
jgi:hypothetical protein